jgi:ketosteroid isomerase-like protein
MKRAIFMGTALLGLSLLCASAFAQDKANSGSGTAQAWAGEEAYWRYAKAHDVKNFLTLWSDDFIGWPIAEQHPVHKTEIAAPLKSGGSLSQVVSYELHRESVEMHGSAVITYYRTTVRRRNADGAESTATYRVTHTWMKRAGTWQIVGGMSATDPAPAADAKR